MLTLETATLTFGDLHIGSNFRFDAKGRTGLCYKLSRSEYILNGETHRTSRGAKVSLEHDDLELANFDSDDI